MQKTFGSAVTVVALAFLFTACSRRDSSPEAEIRRKIVGTWSKYKTVEGSNEFTFGGRFTVIIHPDSSFTTKVTEIPPKGTNTLVLKGTWQLTNMDLTVVVTNATGEIRHEAVGTVEHLKILRVDEHELVHQDPSDQTTFLKRIKGFHDVILCGDRLTRNTKHATHL